MSDIAGRTRPVFFENGKTRAYATGGAVAQDGKLAICQCNTCDAEVVWAKSRRTGRHYLVNIFHGYQGARFYVKSSFHVCTDYISDANRDRVMAHHNQETAR